MGTVSGVESESEQLAAGRLLSALRSGVWFDATAIARPYHKRPVDFLREKGTRAYIQRVMAAFGVGERAIIHTERGGTLDTRMSRMAPCMGLLYARWVAVDLYEWLVGELGKGVKP